MDREKSGTDPWRMVATLQNTFYTITQSKTTNPRGSNGSTNRNTQYIDFFLVCINVEIQL